MHGKTLSHIIKESGGKRECVSGKMLEIESTSDHKHNKEAHFFISLKCI